MRFNFNLLFEWTAECLHQVVMICDSWLFLEGSIPWHNTWVCIGYRPVLLLFAFFCISLAVANLGVCNFVVHQAGMEEGAFRSFLLHYLPSLKYLVVNVCTSVMTALCAEAGEEELRAKAEHFGGYY